MDWTKGYSAQWRVYEVDPSTWADAGVLEGATSVSINRDGTGDVPLLESGSISMDTGVGASFQERYLRVVMYAEQAGGVERVDVGTMLYVAANGTVDKGRNAVELVGRSVLYPASTRQLITGAYAPRGTDGAQWCATMLREAIMAPVEVFGGFTLDTNVVFDVGTTYLAAVWQILNAGGYVIQIDGSGKVNILPMPTEPSLLLDDAGAKLLHPGIPYSSDGSAVPNRYTAIDGDLVATVVNDNPASEVSTIRRGYVLDKVDTSPTRVNGESLEQYAARQLETLSIIPDERTYTREYYPGIVPYCVVRGTLTEMNFDGDMRVMSQSLTCDKGIIVQEKAQREVKLWQR